jgi:hypothetical protein
MDDAVILEPLVQAAIRYPQRYPNPKGKHANRVWAMEERREDANPTAAERGSEAGARELHEAIASSIKKWGSRSCLSGKCSSIKALDRPSDPSH